MLKELKPPDGPPRVCKRLCVGSSVVPESADNAIDPFGRWVYRALLGAAYSRLADRTPGASLRNLPTAAKLHRLAEAARGPRTRAARITGQDGHPIGHAGHDFASVDVDGVNASVSMRKPLRMKVTPEALSWLFGALHADLCAKLAASPAATERESAADAAETLFTEEQLQTMRECQISMYCYSARGSRWLMAAPKMELQQCNNRLHSCPGRKRFRIRAVHDKRGTVRRSRCPADREQMNLALRKGAARALAAASAYHLSGRASAPTPDSARSQPSNGGDASDSTGSQPSDGGAAFDAAASDSAGSKQSNGGADDKSDLAV